MFTWYGTCISHWINKIKTLRIKSFHQYLSQKYTDKFNFQNINEQDILLIIDKLVPKSSCGFDGISSKIIKMIKVCLTKPITLFINEMLNTGIFHDKLKISHWTSLLTIKVTPLSKYGVIINSTKKKSICIHSN